MKDYSRRRIEKAEETVAAARILLADGHLDSAADRVYYAMFYLAEALLFERGLEFSSHGAVHGAFGKEFAKTRALDPQYHAWLLRAFEIRQRATYGIDAALDSEGVRRLIGRAEEFLAAARRYLEAGE